MAMKKKEVIEQVQAYLAEELSQLVNAASPEEVARAAEIQKQLVMYRFLPMREYGKDDVVCPSALVELELNGRRAFYFIVPQGGGLVTSVGGVPVQVITPQSPLGEVLLGKKAGEEVRVETSGGGHRVYRIVSLV